MTETRIIPNEIILCSSNKGKFREFNMAGEKLNIKFQAISELIPGFDPEETEDSFYGNALLKAKAGAKATGKYCLADDSGIEIDCFDKRPGIYSGRFLKKPNKEFLLKGTFDLSQKLEQEYPSDHSKALEIVIQEAKEPKTCRFVCCLVLVNKQGDEIFNTTQYWEGKINNEIKGTNGFGYDPIVIPNEYPDKTVAELDNETKAKLSHRAKAIKEFVSPLQN